MARLNLGHKTIWTFVRVVGPGMTGSARSVLMGLQFFPRGGSAHVARNLARNLPVTGWEPTIVSGSLSMLGRPGGARDFYRGLDVRPFDMTAALDTPDPMRAEWQLHPSYEDRPGAPDRVFAALDDETFERQAHAWARALEAAGAAERDILHLHHLTPINAAAAQVAPDVPVVGHLHGTELLMLEAIEADPGRWAHARAWAERLREWAAACRQLIVLSPSQIARAGVLVGGFPGEWEGEHPLEAIRRTGAQDVFLAGWHDHEELPDFLAAADAVVLPSVREQFGQVLVEGAACGLPSLAVDAFGPAEIVRDGDTGWLVPPDDRAALAAALVEVVNDWAERRRRCERAAADAHERYAWPALAELVAGVYDAAR